MERNGFTLVELLITMVIMTILLVLAVVNLRSNEANARDEERKTDATIIAQQLENYYEAGSDTGNPGVYPATTNIDTESEVRAILPDLNPRALRAPDVAEGSTMSFAVAATAAAQTPTVNAYIYQPLKPDGTLCTSYGLGAANECQRFVLYYKLETVAGTQTIKSKHQ